MEKRSDLSKALSQSVYISVTMSIRRLVLHFSQRRAMNGDSQMASVALLNWRDFLRHQHCIFFTGCHEVTAVAHRDSKRESLFVCNVSDAVNLYSAVVYGAN